MAASTNLRAEFPGEVKLVHLEDDASVSRLEVSLDLTPRRHDEVVRPPVVVRHVQSRWGSADGELEINAVHAVVRYLVTEAGEKHGWHE